MAGGLRSWSRGGGAARSKGGCVIIGTDTVAITSDTDIAGLIEQSLSDDKAIDPVTIDLTGKTSIADTMVIATGSSRRHIEAMAEHVLERLKARGMAGTLAEGRGQSDWVLIDAGDVIVHLFRDETRRFYDLERLWGSALPEKERKVAASASA
ncbi:MAG: ribosome silencing factor [Alphaproteobacteria bacterium]